MMSGDHMAGSEGAKPNDKIKQQTFSFQGLSKLLNVENLGSATFWLFGLLSVSAVYTYFLLLFIPQNVRPALELSFLAKQVSILLLFLGGTLGISRLVTGVLFAFEWVPFASSRFHNILRTWIFILLSCLMTVFASQNHFLFIDERVDALLTLSVIGVVCIITATLSFFRNKPLGSLTFVKGLAVFGIALTIYGSALLAAARVDFLENSNPVIVCLEQEVALQGSLVSAEGNFIILHIANDSNARWVLLPLDKPLLIISGDPLLYDTGTSPSCSLLAVRGAVLPSH